MGSNRYGFGTRAVHCGLKAELRNENTLDLEFRNDEFFAIENKTKVKLEKCIASLEQGKYALCFSSGTAAVLSIAQLLEKRDHIVIFDSAYHGTRTLFTLRNELGNLDITFGDLRDSDNLPKYLKKNTKMVWLETPSNPLMKLIDIAAIAQIVKTQTKAILVVDNTFMSPFFQNPLLLGADISMHSATKYLNGHTDVIMGAAAMNSDELYRKIKEASTLIGTHPSPVDCYLVLRGLKTLHLRMEKHYENALQVARFLEKHPNVEKVNYPGLESHPQHDLAVRQCRGFSGMLSFNIRGGTTEVKKFASKIKLFLLAVSLGSIESLCDTSSLMTARFLPEEIRNAVGITENIVRLSIGLESAKDLIEDLDQALTTE